MLNEKKCQYCQVKLVNRRSHIKHCSSSCRSKAWRDKQQKLTSVKILLTNTQLEILRDEATALGILINELIINRATQTPDICNYNN